MSARMHDSQRSSDNVQLNIEGIKDIEELRKPYELPHHWALRKEFIQIYQDSYDLDRLVCLSNVFVNVECMGLTYPEQVMKLIKELGTKVRGLEAYKYHLEKDEPELPRKQAGQASRQGQQQQQHPQQQRYPQQQRHQQQQRQQQQQQQQHRQNQQNHYRHQKQRY